MLLPDSATIHVCTVLSSCAFGVMFLGFWRIRERAPFYLLCGAASLTYAATLIGLAVPGRGLLVSTLLCVGLGAYNSFTLAAVRSFEGKRMLDVWTIAPPILSGVSFAALAILPDGAAAGRIANSVVLGVSTIALAAILLRTHGSRAPHSRRILGFIQLAYVPCYVASVVLDVSRGDQPDWLALIPLLSDQLLLGVLNIALLAMPGERAESALRRAALIDPLTGAWNRAGLAEIERTIVLPATVILFDVDHFKQVNDRHGHAAGDAVLVSLVAATLRALPANGHLVRLGGDEFVAVLPGGIDAVAARHVAEGLRSIKLPVASCTLSLGMAFTLNGEQELAPAFSRADALLYRAKADGRNCLAA